MGRTILPLRSLVVAVLGLGGACAGCGNDVAAGQTLPPPTDGGVLETRTVACDDAGALPTDLRCTGLYSDFDARQISPDVRPFGPAFSLWSDGATKRRWMYLPPGSVIDTTDMDEWVFPVGTKVWKEFSVGNVLETRMFVKSAPSEWLFTTYVWMDDDARASRLDTGRPNAVGTYEIPNAVECSQCHDGHADRLLGFEAISLALPGATGLTLDALAKEGRLSAPPPTTTLALPGDDRAKLALGWLHINCGVTCHSPTATGTASFTGMHLRLSAKALLAGGENVTDTEIYRTTVGQPFAASRYVDDPRYVGFLRIAPGAPDKSLVVAVVSLRGDGQMPPIVSHVVDPEGIGYLRDWIASLP
jgi:hypothetical protein